MVSYDGFFVISTFRIGNQPVKDINVEKYSKSIWSMLLSLRDLGYLTFCDSAGELFQLTDMGWHYHEVSLRGALKLFAQSRACPARCLCARHDLDAATSLQSLPIRYSVRSVPNTLTRQLTIN